MRKLRVPIRRSENERPLHARDPVPRKSDRLQHVGGCGDCGSGGAEGDAAKGEVTALPVICRECGIRNTQKADGASLVPSHPGISCDMLRHDERT